MILFSKERERKDMIKVKTNDEKLDVLVPRIQYFLSHDTVDFDIMGKKVHGYRSPDAPSLWIRDHSDMMRGAKYFDADMKSAIEYFASMQNDEGWILDYVTMFPEKLPGERENWIKHVRVPVEADVEYRFIKAIRIAWEVTGDDEWVYSLLPKMEKAINYIITNEYRWDPKSQLVKRALTIDTWDFDYTAGRHDWLNFNFSPYTFWGIMHGDNSGYYEAIKTLAFFFEYFSNIEKANYYYEMAEGIKERANILCFNGRFYTHHVPITPRKIEGVDESLQLSLSNPMDINRGMATHDIAVSIIKEYQERLKNNKSFAEWYSIDPPYPKGIFGDEKIVEGAYCNGGIMPLVGGELALAAFDHGFEKYGVETLYKYSDLTKDNETYLWYFPDGTKSSIDNSTSPDALPTDGWGSSAMLMALVEGLIGIKENFKKYESVFLSPKLKSANIKNAEIMVEYESSSSRCGYNYEEKDDKLVIQMTSSHKEINAHIYTENKCKKVLVDGKEIQFNNVLIENSNYVDFKLIDSSNSKIELFYK